MLAALDQVGNPSSIHLAGRAARRLLEHAREQVADWSGLPADIVFTSGGTEANALAIHALRPGRRLIVGATEHDAVRTLTWPAEILPVDANGTADLDVLDALLAQGPALVCLMAANNETGTIQPIASAMALCESHGSLLHVDAVQAAGRIGLPRAHSLAISSHKLGGPMGAGAWLVAPTLHGPALIAGGGQERGRRGGTPALPAIAGMAAALGAPGDLSGMRDLVERAAIDCGAVVLGGSHRLGNTACMALPGVPAQTQVIALDLAGIQVSAGAACSSGKVARSHVLSAMGAGPLAAEAIRVSLPWNATEQDAASFASAYRAMAARLYRRAA